MLIPMYYLIQVVLEYLRINGMLNTCNNMVLIRRILVKGCQLYAVTYACL